MAINKKLINFETKALFQSANGINTTTSSQTKPEKDALGLIILNNIPWRSLVTIDDTNEIWTHGQYFGGYISGDTIYLGGNSYTIQNRENETKSWTPTSAAGINLDLQWKEVPKAGYDSILNKDGTYLVQIEWGKAIYTGTFPYKELHQDTTYSSDSDCPVINTDEEVVLTACGYIPSTKGRLYLKLAAGSRTTTETIANVKVEKSTKPSLFIATTKENLSLDGLTFKFRQLI